MKLWRLPELDAWRAPYAGAGTIPARRSIPPASRMPGPRPQAPGPPRQDRRGSTRFSRATLVLTLLGAFSVVLLSLPYKAFDLDRFFVPKELILHMTAVVTGLITLARRPRPVLDRTDTLLVAFVAVGVVSALFAENWWLATRSLAITASGFVMFWVARTLASEGYERHLICGLATAVVAGAITALLQAYGVEPEYVSLSRAPGGTFGNRNFMAHLSAIGMPILLLCALESRKPWGFAVGLAGNAVVAAALVLSRSRAAWLALIVGASLLLLIGWRMRTTWSDPRRRRRLSILAGSAAVGVVGALLLPNALEWKSDSPYLDSVKGVVNYREGSGAGRVQQYRNSLELAKRHPVLGVGPGNWAVAYPAVASRNDPSLNDDGMTSNPWPSSDWVAFLSERGGIAVALLMLAMVGLLVGASVRARSAAEPSDRLAALALATTIVITGIVAAFDAVLSLAIPAMFVWSIAGALAPAARPRIALSQNVRGPLIGVAAMLGALVILRGAGQIAAMSTFTAATTTRAATSAALFDPGSYRIHVRLAESFAARGDCRRVRQFAGAARELYPNAPVPKRLLRRCGRG